jgi:hypothetical protein
VESLQEFPGKPKLQTSEDAAREEDFFRRQKIEARRIRDQAEFDQNLDSEVASIFSIKLERIENEWGWTRSDSGERYSPTSDSALAFELLQLCRLGVRFLDNDVEVSFSARHSAQPLFVFASDYGNSLPRTIAVAAVRQEKFQK